jgi:hypothetical protein
LLDNARENRILGIVLWADFLWALHEIGGGNVFKNVLDAIRDGDWFFEPAELDPAQYAATRAIPGTEEKLAVLAARARAGLPLWHESDRSDYEDQSSEVSS